MESDGDNVGDIGWMMIIMCMLSRHLSIYALYAIIVIILVRVCLPVPGREYACQGTVYGVPNQGDEREHQRATSFLNLTWFRSPQTGPEATMGVAEVLACDLAVFGAGSGSYGGMKLGKGGMLGMLTGMVKGRVGKGLGREGRRASEEWDRWEGVAAPKGGRGGDAGNGIRRGSTG